MPVRTNAADDQAGGYRVELDRRLVPIALLIPLALFVDVISKVAGFGTDVRLAFASAAGTAFVGLAVATSTNRAVAGAGRPARHPEMERLRGAVAALADDKLTALAGELFWTEIDLDESVAPHIKALLHQNLQEAMDQLRDPKTAAEGRDRLRNFCFVAGPHRGGRRARSPRRTVVALGTKETCGLVNVAVDLERGGDLAGAEAAYRTADAAGDIIGAVRLGALLERRAAIESAEGAYRRADLRGSAAGSARLGRLLENRGDLSGAEAAYRRADGRGSPAGSAALASVLERRGELEAAEAAYDRMAYHTRQLIGDRADPGTQIVAERIGERVPFPLHAAHITRLTFARGRVQLDELEAALSDAVSEILRPGSDAAELAHSVGVLPSSLEGATFLVEEVHQALDPSASSVAVSVGSTLPAHAVTLVWTEVISPQLTRRLGAGALGDKREDRSGPSSA